MIQRFGKMKLSGFILIGATTLCFAFISYKQVAAKWTAPAEADKKKNPVASDATSIAAGKDIYTKNCASCHGKKGKGDGPKSADLDKVPNDFSKSDFTKQTDGAIFWKISEGKKPMPSFKKDLTDEQRWSVINYIRTFGPPKVTTPPPKTDTVKTKPPKTDTTKTKPPKTDTTKTNLIKVDSVKPAQIKADTLIKNIPKTDPPKTDSTKTIPPKTDATQTAGCDQKKCCKKKKKNK